jgi:exodeoxyribonuclease VII large subunit
LDLVADVRASTPTDAAKKVVPDIAEEFELINQLTERARRRVRNVLELETQRIASLRQRPVLKDPLTLVSTRAEIIASLRERSHRSTVHALSLAREELVHVYARVRSLSPQATLDRGYAVVQREDGSVARDPHNLFAGERLRLRLALGEINAVTVESRE